MVKTIGLKILMHPPDRTAIHVSQDCSTQQSPSKRSSSPRVRISRAKPGWNMFDHVKTWLTHSLARTRTHALGLGATSLGRRVKLRLAWPPRDGGSSAALYCPISPEADISGQAVDRRGGRRRVKKHPGSPRVETHKSGTSDGASVRPAPVRSQLGAKLFNPDQAARPTQSLVGGNFLGGGSPPTQATRRH